MPRARKPDPVTVDMFGFDPVGTSYTTTADENRALLGLGPLALATYHVLKRFALASGRVPAASYYRIGQVLAHRAQGPGRRQADPTRDQLRGVLARLADAGLVFMPRELNEQRGALQIHLTNGVGVIAKRRIAPGYRPGSNTPQSRASA